VDHLAVRCPRYWIAALISAPKQTWPHPIIQVANVRHQEGRYLMSKKTVEFDAHKVEKQETDIKFTKKDGTPVEFEANVPVKVPVHVKFKVNTDKKR